MNDDMLSDTDSMDAESSCSGSHDAMIYEKTIYDFRQEIKERRKSGYTSGQSARGN
jgi:hypothetical protein